ncbi:MAG: hypothetical protein KIT48_04535 [Pseudolabrys sp.]|nr:hypothetical protein [Pseudolabrys sp.]
MKVMPQKLFDMVQQGVSEDEVQIIFDALIHAEEQGKVYVNAYQGDETTFLFTNDGKQADQQLSFFREKVRRPAIGFVNFDGDWQERVS